MLTDDEERQFRRWLESNTDLRDRSVSDVISRTRRVMRMIDPTEPASDNELEFRLSEQGEFVDCSMSVKSQLKRAARLYRRFLDHDPNRKGGSRK